MSFQFTQSKEQVGGKGYLKEIKIKNKIINKPDFYRNKKVVVNVCNAISTGCPGD